jgi:DNA polymerase-3 subunit gamma/tau
MTFTADAVQHSEISETGGTLRFVTPKEFRLSMKEPDIRRALAQLGAGAMKVSVEFAAEGPGPASPANNSAPAEDNELTTRALAHPEVKRFREMFGGQVRAVRNLKE